MYHVHARVTIQFLTYYLTNTNTIVYLICVLDTADFFIYQASLVLGSFRTVSLITVSSESSVNR